MHIMSVYRWGEIPPFSDERALCWYDKLQHKHTHKLCFYTSLTQQLLIFHELWMWMGAVVPLPPLRGVGPCLQVTTNHTYVTSIHIYFSIFINYYPSRALEYCSHHTTSSWHQSIHIYRTINITKQICILVDLTCPLEEAEFCQLWSGRE